MEYNEEPLVYNYLSQITRAVRLNAYRLIALQDLTLTLL